MLRNKLSVYACCVVMFFSVIGLPLLTYSQKNILNERVHISEPSAKVVIAENGNAMHPIVVSIKATDTVKALASKLANFLSQLSSSNFQVKNGDGSTGIAIGLNGDFPSLNTSIPFDINHPGQYQGYEIKTHQNGIQILGVSIEGLTYAAYDLLGKLGYRNFFPMKKWEIIPKKNKLEFASHIIELPDYYNRRVWPGHGFWPEYEKISKQWDDANANGGYQLNTSHSYDNIVLKNKEEFDKHPEYYALVNGKRNILKSEAKFCISNIGLQNLVIQYVLNEFAKSPNLKSVSLDPSDGGGWCQCDDCAKMGTVSTRALYLANRAAEETRKKYAGKKIGMYAYNMHSPPPQIDVDKDVVVSTATFFISGGLTIDDLIKGWSDKKAVVGIREYYDVYIWSKFIPGKSLASNLNYLKTTIPDFYNKGARYLTSEASDDWGPSGLGYFLANKILWNIDNASKADSIITDFTTSAFGEAANNIKQYYSYIDGSKPLVMSSDLVAKMYNELDKARKVVNGDVDILSRIDDLVLYTKYVELYKNYDIAMDAVQKQKTFNDLMNFIAGIKHYRIIHTNAIELGTHWKTVSPNVAKYTKSVWKDVQYNNADITQIINDGIKNNELFDFVPIDFSEKLVQSKTLEKQQFEIGKLGPRRGDRTYYTWVQQDLQPITMSITGGLIVKYRNRGNVKAKLIKLGGASEDGTFETLIAEDTTTVPNGIANIITLTPKQTGLHAVKISDGMDMTSDFWMNYDKTFKSQGGELEGTFYFYVPKNTQKIGMYHKVARGELVDPNGNVIMKFENTNKVQSFPVGKNNDGKIWSFRNVRGIINLMNVPPYFSINPKYLLLPQEVVEKDNLNDNATSEKKKRK